MKRCSVYRTPEGVIQLCRRLGRWKMLDKNKVDHGALCGLHMAEFKAKWPEYDYVEIKIKSRA